MTSSRERGMGTLFYPAPVLHQPNTLPVPSCWAAQTPESQELLLEELDLWVTWLTDRYQLDHRTVPACWQEHGELVEELSALHLAWQGSFASSSAPDEPLRWHERFASARARIADWVARTGCRPDAHRGG